MKNERLFTAIGGIEESYIEQSERPINQKNFIVKYGSIAACFGIVALCSFLLLRSPNDKTWPIKEISRTNSSTEIGKVPTWDELTISEKYPELPFNNTIYSTTVNSIEKDNIGDLLTEVTLTGIEQQTGTQHQINASVFAINGISTDTAVAISFEGNNEWYTYINPYYQPDTLSQFLEDLNLKHIISFGSAWYQAPKNNGEYALIEFVNLVDITVWEMLLSDTTLPAIKDFDSHNFASLMSISVDIPLLGYHNISLSVTEDGYLTTNILDTGKAFFLGTEKVNQFVTYVLENCEGYEIVYTNDGTGVAE